MKSIDINELDQIPGIRLKPYDTFSFYCHSGLSCFNQCCRNLNLFLYPYDVVRLKNRLAITSDQFLDRYVDVVLRDTNFFPEVLLRMSESAEKTCPFLTEAGCSVYPDRPDTCRTFPVEHGMLYNAKTKKTELVHFFRPPDFCMGQHEKDQTWNIQTWQQDQEAQEHNQMTIRWAEVKSLFQNNPWGREGAEGTKAKMAFMSAYNMDQFREFVFNSSFLKRYKVKADILKKIKNNDLDLLKFGFEWIKFYLWGIKTKYFRLR